jgi:hypothetical protein
VRVISGPAVEVPVTQEREFWVLMGYAVALGILGAFAGLVFMGVVKAGGGARSWISRREGVGEEGSKMNTVSGFAGAYGGLFSSTLIVVMLLMEVARPGGQRFVKAPTASIVASSVSFGIYFAIAGSVFLAAARRVHDPGGALQTAPILIAVVTALLTMEGIKSLLARREQAHAAAKQTVPPNGPGGEA